MNLQDFSFVLLDKMIVELVLFFVAFFTFCYFTNSRRGLRIYHWPPGPRGVPILGNLPFLGKIPHKTISEYGQKFGGLFTLDLGAFRVVVLNDYEVMKRALKEDAFSGRPSDKILIFQVVSKGIGFNQHKPWQEQRRFGLKTLRDFGFGKSPMEDLIRQEFERLGDYIIKQNGTPIYVKKIFDLAIFNSLTYILMGIKFELDDPLGIYMNKITQEGFLEPGVTSMIYFLPKLAQMFPKWSNFDRTLHAQQFFDNRFRSLLAERRETYNPDFMRDFVDCYIKEIDKNLENPGSSFHEEEGVANFVDTMMDFYMAGADSSSTTLTWAILFFLHWPQVMKKAQAELDSVIGRDKYPDGKDRKMLPYCEAVMWEVFRFSSIVPNSVLHSTTEDAEIEGYYIPARTIIFPNIYSVHNDKAYWGDPENFRPERFINEMGKFEKNERVIPFGTGKRICMAETLAQNQTFIFLAGLLQKFEFHLPKGHKLPSLVGKFGLVLSPEYFEVCFKERY